MKKVLALSLALIFALSMTVSALAASDFTGAGQTATIDGDIFTDYDDYANFNVTLDPDSANPGDTIKAWPVTGFAVDDPTTIGTDESYAGDKITYKDLTDDFTFTYKVVDGDVSSVAVKKASDGTGYIAIVLKDDFSPKSFDLELDLKFREKSSGESETWTVEASDIGYQVTSVYDELLDGDEASLDLYDDDATLAGPVFDFDNCDEGRVEYSLFYRGTVEVTWKGVEGGELFLAVDTTPNTDFLKTYEDIDFEEANFVGKPTLAATAKVYFYTDDDKTCLYEVKDGKFVPVTGATYNKTEGAWVFSARTLGDYVATTKAIPDAAAEGGKTNPNTGANGFVNLAVVAAVVSLAAVGAVSLKK